MSRLKDLLHWIGEHGYSELLDQLRDQPARLCESVTKELEADFHRDMDNCVKCSVALYDAQPRRTRLSRLGDAPVFATVVSPSGGWAAGVRQERGPTG